MLLRRRRRVHCGEDPHDLGSLGGGDVLGHVHDGIHGNLGIGLDQAAKGQRWVRSESLPQLPAGIPGNGWGL